MFDVCSYFDSDSSSTSRPAFELRYSQFPSDCYTFALPPLDVDEESSYES